MANDIDGLFTLLRSHVGRFELQDAKQDFSHIITLRKLHYTLREVTERCSHTESSEPIYCVGAGLLHETFQRQAAIATETIDYAFGHRHGHLFTVERVVPLALDSSTFGRAEGNLRDTTKVLVESGRYGGLLSCYFHTHPGHGPNANLPSSTDLATQRRFEQSGYAVIGGIFSRDGFLRFFSESKPFKISISGKEVEHVGENLYKLTGMPHGRLQGSSRNHAGC